MTRLQGKAAIVTGGAGGIGRAYALRLARLGADVAILDIDLGVAKRWGEELGAETVAAEIAQLGVRGMELQVDLSDREAATRAVQSVAEAFGRLDILVNNAGGAITPMETSYSSNITDADLDKLMSANFYGTVYTCQAALPWLRREGGSIINVATVAVDLSPANGALAGYSASKAAVLRYTRHLAAETGVDGVRVNAIAPGLIETARVKSQAAARGLGTAEQARKIPLRRLGRPEDCADVLEFLASDLSAYVTGECIRVSGGYTLIAAG